MATEVGFNEGKDRILTPGGGLPATSHFMLVVNKIATDLNAPAPGDLYAVSVYGDVSEVSWSGATPYARKSGATPNPVNGIVTYTLPLVWTTSAATNGPADCRTLILLDNANSKIIYGWDIPALAGQTAVMNLANASLDLNPGSALYYFLQNVGGN